MRHHEVGWVKQSSKDLTQYFNIKHLLSGHELESCAFYMNPRTSTIVLFLCCASFSQVEWCYLLVLQINFLISSQLSCSIFLINAKQDFFLYSIFLILIDKFILFLMDENGPVHVLFNYYVQGSREFEGKVKQFYIFAFYVNQTHHIWCIIYAKECYYFYLFILFFYLLNSQEFQDFWIFSSNL